MKKVLTLLLSLCFVTAIAFTTACGKNQSQGSFFENSQTSSSSSSEKEEEKEESSDKEDGKEEQKPSNDNSDEKNWTKFY